jgi:uncharacterized membrane protein YkoI
MFAKRFTELALAIALSTIPISVLARKFSDTTKPALAQQQTEADRAAIFQEIKVFANVQFSVREVIAIAEKRAVGAKVVDISFDGQAGRFAYSVKSYVHDEISAVMIDASTGTTIGDAIVTPVSALDVKDKIELAGFGTAVVDLSDAVSIAELYGSGKAVSVGLDEENGKLIFLVVVVTDGSLIQISVDPNEAPSPLRKVSVGRKN